MRYTRSLITLCFTLLFVVDAYAQGWQWGRRNTCTNLDGWGTATDQLGNVYAAGINAGARPAVFGTYKLPNGGNSIYQCVIAKYDPDGNFLWANGTQNGRTYLMNIATDFNNNVFMFGAFLDSVVHIGAFKLSKPPAVDVQYFLAKFDPSGNVVWAVNAGNAEGNYAFVGGICHVLSTGAIATDEAGYIYITCNFHLPVITIGPYTLTNTDPSGTTNDILLAKYDPSGNVVWAKSAGGTGSDNAYGITISPSSDIYIAGIYNSPSITFGASVVTNYNSDTLSQAFIARFDGNGNAVWADSSDGAGKVYAVGVASDGVGNVYMTGGFKANQISFSGTVITDPDSAKPVLYLVKFAADNSVSWYKTIRSASDSDAGTWGYAVAVSVCNTIWVSGIMTKKIIIDSATLTAPAASCIDPVFIAGYDQTGNYISSAGLQSGGDDQVGIACDRQGNVFLCSDFACAPITIGDATFGSVIQADSDCIGGGEEMYVAKYSVPSTTVVQSKITNKVICNASETSLAAPQGYKYYLWYDSSQAATHAIKDGGSYWVYCTNDCVAPIVDTFKITIDCDCGRFLFLPNSFTPNGDGQNDVFYPRASYAMKLIRNFRIYNRWGELLFERDNIQANDVQNAWDGSYKGNVPLPDVYIWVVEAVCENGSVVSKKGSVTVIR